MSRWFRHYTGMVRDEKLVAVAIRSKQPIERVMWVWGAILESASEIDDGGRFEVDPVEVAYFLRADEADVDAVFAALTAAGRVADGTVVKWGDRQYQSDKSAERQARYRERKQAGNRNGNGGKATSDVTPPSRDVTVTPQEADTDTEAASQLGASAKLYDRLLEAASSRGRCHQNLAMGIQPIVDLIGKGFDVDADILPVIRERAGPERRSWAYFVAIIVQRQAERQAIPSKAQPAAVDWAARMRAYYDNDTWAMGWGPRPGEPGCKAPADLVARAAA